MQSVTISDFSGGITDDYVDCAVNKYQKCDNLIIEKDGKLRSRFGSRLFDSNNPQLPEGSKRVSDIFYISDDLFFIQNGKIFEYDSGFSEISFINNPFKYGDDDSSFNVGVWNNMAFVTINDRISGNYCKPIKLYQDEDGDMQIRTSGLPVPSGVTATADVGGEENLYTYRIFFYYEYYVGETLYQDWSSDIEVQVGISGEDITADNITLENLPEIVNGTEFNYDIDNIKIKIFRTEINGTDFHLLATLDHGEDEYVDDTPDSEIANSEAPYNQGDVIRNNGTTPYAKFVHVNGSVAWYGNIKDGSTIYPYRLYNSVPFDPDSVQDDAYIDLEDSIFGISSFLERAIVLGERNIYRVDGLVDETGTGNLSYQKLHSSAGCFCSSSIVQIPSGIVWAGRDGFYYSDGMSVYCISDGLKKTYASLTQTKNQKERIYGKYDDVGKRVYWSFQSGIGVNSEIDMQFILDLNFGISNDSTFTTASNENVFSPTAFIFRDGEMIRGDRGGFLLQHKKAYLNDIKINPSVHSNSWGLKEIIYHHISGASSFGSLMYRKYITKIVLDATNESNLSVQIISNNDLNKQRTFLKPIRDRSAIAWGQSNIPWGTAGIKWNESKLIEEIRRFHSNSLRCSFKQIEITNAYVKIINSDVIGNIVIAGGTGNNDYLPSDVDGQFLSFSHDDYDKQYPINTKIGSYIYFSDPFSKIVSCVDSIFTSNSHGKDTGDLISFSSDNMPDEILIGTNYYVISLNSNTYMIATSLQDALDGTYINVANCQINESSYINGSQPFEISGIPKSEIIRLLSYTIHYDILGKTQKEFSSSSVGGNEQT